MTSEEKTVFFAFPLRVVCAVMIANLLPLIGLAGFQWGLTELLVVYWAEAVIGTVVGMIQTFPTRLVDVPLPHPRSEPLLKVRHGALSVGPLTGYVRNASVIGAQSMFLFVFFSSALALFVPASPLYYSSHETIETVVIVAGVLAGTHLLTAKVYFDEQRYERAPAKQAFQSWFRTGAGVTGLVVLLWLRDGSGAGSVLAAWPVGLSYILIVGKIAMTLFFRCRDRDRFELPEYDVSPFEDQSGGGDPFRTAGVTAVTLPRVERPATQPRATARPSIWRILGLSPILGLFMSRTGDAIVFLLFAIFTIVADVPLVLTLIVLTIALVFAVVPVLVFTLPRHATLTYEFYGDQLVCYDHWLEEPVWQLASEDIRAVSHERGIDAWIGGYGTVVIETDDGPPARLSYLRDYDKVTDRLERVIETESGQYSGENWPDSH
ncbi:DUF6498-containing protein [Natrinema salaciae]|uniref:Uncharacterized protein n=1 Tax=Natrinema salaciae TaxID=1186196 RepID=A0A1H9KDP0_9EURY|nr:DUF6498-containing protein [Natrinema salaciae]SEQ97015.1 hypothetical protein SAMN04489841_2885 [Natrinema salaciae]